jgi:hypothetical protein
VKAVMSLVREETKGPEGGREKTPLYREPVGHDGMGGLTVPPVSALRDAGEDNAQVPCRNPLAQAWRSSWLFFDIQRADIATSHTRGRLWEEGCIDRAGKHQDGSSSREPNQAGDGGPPTVSTCFIKMKPPRFDSQILGLAAGSTILAGVAVAASG